MKAEIHSTFLKYLIYHYSHLPEINEKATEES